MEAFKCLSHQIRQLFVGETFILLTMKQFGYPNFGIFLNFNFISNEANKGIIL
jgi:hypothetical protein